MGVVSHRRARQVWQMGLVAAIVLVVAFTGRWAQAEAEKPIVIHLAAQNLCPLGCWNENNEFRGSFVDMLTETLDSMNVRLELSVVPWGRAQQMARSDVADGFFPAFETPERDLVGVMSTGLTSNTWAWYLLKGSNLDPLSTSFRNTARIGAVRNGVMAGWLERNGYKLDGKPANQSALLEMLLAGRLEAVLDTREALGAIAQDRNVQDRLKSITMKEQPVGVYFSYRFLEAHPGFLERFNTTVLRLMTHR